jgi:hypothetical protein
MGGVVGGDGTGMGGLGSSVRAGRGCSGMKGLVGVARAGMGWRVGKAWFA